MNTTAFVFDPSIYLFHLLGRSMKNCQQLELQLLRLKQEGSWLVCLLHLRCKTEPPRGFQEGGEWESLLPGTPLLFSWVKLIKNEPTVRGWTWLQYHEGSKQDKTLDFVVDAVYHLWVNGVTKLYQNRIGAGWSWQHCQCGIQLCQTHLLLCVRTVRLIH